MNYMGPRFYAVPVGELAPDFYSLGMILADYYARKASSLREVDLRDLELRLLAFAAQDC